MTYQIWLWYSIGVDNETEEVGFEILTLTE